jgi:nanoRNase/pAp phosphatase (c-di-AMP/oligoRNAs hydrolase)
VARIAGKLGGGGHVNASACRVEGELEAVMKMVLETIAVSR